MSLLPLHVDRHLARLAASGTLPPRQWSRMLRHARGCARCGPRYERVVHMQRVLAHGTLVEPTSAELESIEARGLAAALASAADGRSPARGTAETRAGHGDVSSRHSGRAWSGWTEDLSRAWALAAVAACALLLLAAPQEETEWSARGEGDGSAVLRLFCVPEDAALREVKSTGTCPPGAALAFAAGVRPPLTHAVVVVRGAEGTRVEGPFEVRSPPGAEAALDVTPRLPASGDVEVTAIFAPSPQAALAAARGEPAEGATRVQHRVRVEAAP
jgi:hypothetical protein